MSDNELPPGQKEFPSFDRFGLGLFADRLASVEDKIALQVGGNVENSITVQDELETLPRAEITADFHCVTTWSVRNVRWSGWRFKDFYESIVVPCCKPREKHHFVVLKSQDDYRVSMQLDDLLQDDVLLADTLNGDPLGMAHGAPIRLVAPKHYGYKNAKHLYSIEFKENRKGYSFPFPYPNFMDHPRGRVAYEERASFLPLWIVRPLYAFLQPGARKKHRKALAKFDQPK